MIVTFSPRQRDYAPAEFLAAGRPKAHPDVPARLDGLLAGVVASGHAIVEPEDHGLTHVARVHDPRYLDFLETAHGAWRQLPQAADQMVPNVHPRRSGGPYPRAIVGRAGYHLYDMSCPITAETWSAVLWNAHSAASAALRVADGAAPSAYALCRPPGHHAGPDYAGGFCFLNNAAVAADILCRRFGRVATLDIDVH
ncbi:MAG: histone deacetylase family protein, partial [Zavarzinia sp.]|nr:histone deacetylase family protein [Zavarzinia sp.]